MLFANLQIQKFVLHVIEWDFVCAYYVMMWLTVSFWQMFMFGTKAVEQFVDRLIEWPQYCNHILQISHLRSTHVELVSFIEQALLRISAGHSDSDGNIHASAGSTQAASGNMEVATDFSNNFFVALRTAYIFDFIIWKYIMICTRNLYVCHKWMFFLNGN